MWRKMFQKYEDMEERDELAYEVALEDIDKIETVNNIFKGGMQASQVQPCRTLKQYFREHAQEMDEIATIAGQTFSDEEVLSDDSDNELIYNCSDDPNNDVVREVGNKLPLTPATSDEENSDVGDIENNDQDGETDATLRELSEDINESLVESDKDDMLYTAGLQQESKNIFDQSQPESSSLEPMS